MSVNKVTLLGHVGKDPEVKTLESGVKVANFSLATTERGYKLQNGTEVPERTEWHNIVVWKGLAEVAEKYIKKGSRLYLEGKITTRSWDKDGIKHYRTEILVDNLQMLDKKPETTSRPWEETAGTFKEPQKVEMPGEEGSGFPF
jgi:single-strand DNA-binding protein